MIYICSVDKYHKLFLGSAVVELGLYLGGGSRELIRWGRGLGGVYIRWRGGSRGSGYSMERILGLADIIGRRRAQGGGYLGSGSKGGGRNADAPL